MDLRKGAMLSGTILILLAMFISGHADAQSLSACGVNVYGLDVEGSRLVGYIQNTGSGLELITYGFYVNGEAVRTGSFELNVSTTRKIEHTYSFGHGEYSIELRAGADCNASDYERIVHTILEPYMCQNPSGFEGQDYCDYTSTRYMICLSGQWVVEDVNEGEYCYNCNACGDDICNCGETADTCWSDCRNICTPEYLDTYRCNGDWRQRLYINSDCDYEWRNLERCYYECDDGYCVGDHDYCTTGWKCKDSYNRGYQRSDCTWTSVTYCPDGCYNGYCGGYGHCTTGWKCKDSYNRGYQRSDCTWTSVTYCQYGCEDGNCRSTYPGTCGVAIEGMDYINQIAEGSPAWVKVTMKNTGSRRETLTAKLYIDSSYWGSEKADLYSGSKADKTFNFYLSEGTHNIKVEVSAGCGSTGSKLFTITVQGSGSPAPQACNYNGVCEYGETYQTCPHDCPRPEPVPSYTTGIDVHPTSLDIESGATGTVSIDITSSRKQTFSIEVSGVSAEWVSHPGSLEVDSGTKRVYLYITPREEGTHALSLAVKALGENLQFTETVSFYVSPRQEGGDGLAGFLTAVPPSIAALIIGIIIVAAIVIYIGYRRMRPEDEIGIEIPQAIPENEFGAEAKNF